MVSAVAIAKFDKHDDGKSKFARDYRFMYQNIYQNLRGRAGSGHNLLLNPHMGQSG